MVGERTLRGLVGATALVAAACAPNTPSGRIWPSPTGSWEPAMPDACEGYIGQTSIGEDITCSTAIVLVRIVRFDEPIWNSPDGRDWTAEYYAAPDEGIVPPVAVTPVVVHVEKAYTARGPRDAPGDPPPIADGSNLNVYFTAAVGFEPRDRRVFFLRWTRMWLSDGTTTSLLLGQVSQSSWVVTDDGTAFPWDSSQRYSLVSAARRGDVSLTGTTCQPTLTLEGFEAVVRQELERPGPDFATFDRWPPEPVQREVYEHTNVPDEWYDPDWCPAL